MPSSRWVGAVLLVDATRLRLTCPVPQVEVAVQAGGDAIRTIYGNSAVFGSVIHHWHWHDCERGDSWPNFAWTSCASTRLK